MATEGNRTTRRRGRAMRTRMRRLVVALAAVLLLAVVSTAPAARDTLVIGVPAGLRGGGILGQVSEPLVRLTVEGKVEPWLVESWEPSRDGRTWTLHTRPKVRFTDGTPFDAETLRFTLERARRQGALAMVESMQVAGARALRVTTRAPFAPFVSALGDHRIVVQSPAQIARGGDEVGTGPFKVVHPAGGREVRLEANDRYWGGKPRLRTIVSRPYADAAARAVALESGEVDLIFQVPPHEAARLAKNADLTVATPPSARVVWLYLNTRRDPFRDKRVRQALYYAIDREAIVKDIFAGAATALHSPGPVGSHGYTARYDRYGYNPEKARALLEAAGAAHLAFTVHSSPGRPLLAGQVLEAVRGDLERVGVTMRVVDVEPGTLARTTAQPVETSPLQATLLGWRSLDGDLDSSLQDFGSAAWPPRGANRAFWRSDEFDRLLGVEQGTLDAGRRDEALRRMQEILMDELPALWLYGEPQIWAARRTLKGVAWSPLESLPPLHAAHFED